MILLIYPPFAMPDKPYISPPTLAAYLLARDMPVTLWDANLSFFRHVMDPGYLKKGGWEPEVPVQDLFGDRAPGKKTSGNTTLGNKDRMALFGQYLEQVRAPDEQFSITDNTGYLRYEAPVSMFDSHGMIPIARRSHTLTRDILQYPLDRVIRTSYPAMTGISVAFPDQILPALTLAAMVKEKDPDIPVVLGGPFVTMHMADVRNPDLFSLVDYLVLGDGEAILPALYGLLKRRGGTPAPRGISGVVYRDENDTIHRAEPQVCSMAESRPPAYGLMPMDDYLVPRSSMAVLFRLSRGCYWGKCAFCNSLSPIINVHEQAGFEKTYDDLITTLDQTQSPIIHFTDDAADPDMLAYLARRLLEDKRQVSWTVNMRVDKRLTLSILSLLRQAGCFSLFLGVESLSDRILKKMKKGTTIKSINRLVLDLAWAGISANIYMIVGFPTETEAEARASFAQVCEWVDKGLVRQVIYNFFSLTPCSPVAAAPRDFGITDLPVPENKDLNPPLSGFTCETGMTRQEAAALCVEFLTILKQLRRN